MSTVRKERLGSSTNNFKSNLLLSPKKNKKSKGNLVMNQLIECSSKCKRKLSDEDLPEGAKLERTPSGSMHFNESKDNLKVEKVNMIENNDSSTLLINKNSKYDSNVK